MPEIKTQRDDILRGPEFKQMLTKLDGKDEIIGTYDTHLDGEPITQKFVIKCRRAECLLCLLWLFGKRISEILTLRRGDLWTDEEYLYIRFRVLKKDTRRSRAIPRIILKKITMKNKYVEYIRRYINTIFDQEAYIFPSKSKPRKVKVKLKDKDSGETIKVYIYERKGGYMRPEIAWKWVKFLNPKAWNHLFRHSIATIMAENEATEEELMNWFDWDRYETAHGYVKGGPRLTRKQSEREW